VAITRSQVIAILLGVALMITTAGTLDTVYSQGEKAPNFNLKTLDEIQVTLDSFSGKPVVLWFMATWCPSCVGQADAIKQIKSEYGDKVNILAIDLWSVQSVGGEQQQGLGGLSAETKEDLKTFLEKFGSPEWKAAMDTDNAAIRHGIAEVDSTVVIDYNGNIVLKHLGPSGYQPLEETLTKIFSSSSS